MQKQHITSSTAPGIDLEIEPARKASPFLQLVEARAHRRHLRIVLPAPPRRRPCALQRAMLAAAREAELAEWLASGGDFLTSMHQPVP